LATAHWVCDCFHYKASKLWPLSRGRFLIRLAGHFGHMGPLSALRIVHAHAVADMSMSMIHVHVHVCGPVYAMHSMQ